MVGACTCEESLVVLSVAVCAGWAPALASERPKLLTPQTVRTPLTCVCTRSRHFAIFQGEQQPSPAMPHWCARVSIEYPQGYGSCCSREEGPDEAFGVAPRARVYPKAFEGVISETEFAVALSEVDRELKQIIMGHERTKCYMSLMCTCMCCCLACCVTGDRCCCPTSLKQKQCVQATQALQRLSTDTLEWSVEFQPMANMHSGGNARAGWCALVMKTPGAEPATGLMAGGMAQTMFAQLLAAQPLHAQPTFVHMQTTGRQRTSII